MKTKLLFLSLLPFFCFAQIPTYYSTIDFSKNGNELKTQLTALITNTHIVNLPYTATGAYSFINLLALLSDNFI